MASMKRMSSIRVTLGIPNVIKVRVLEVAQFGA